MPIIGNLLILNKYRQISEDRGDNYHPAFRSTRDFLGDWKIMNMSVFAGHQIYMLIGDPTIVQELYTTHNKLFDKHPNHKSLTFELTG